MPKAPSRLDAMLDRIRKVTQQTAHRLRTELHHIDAEKKKITAKLDDASQRIRAMLSGLGTGTGPTNGEGGASTTPRKARKRTRIRRNPLQLKQEAESILHFVKSKGEKGARGAEIRQHFPKVGPDIKGFVQKFGGQKLKTTGRKASMRYLHG